MADQSKSQFIKLLEHFEQPLKPARCIISTIHRLYLLELISFEILAAERLLLMGSDNRLIIDCFANVVNIHSELGKLPGGALHTI